MGKNVYRGLMQDEVRALGTLLRTKRKELGLSLKEIENSTSIRSSYLEAIEEGKAHQYISSIYAIGFMRQYANFLGFDIEVLMRDHPLAFRPMPEKHEFSYGIGTLEMRSTSGGGIKWLPNLLWAALGVGMIVALWYLAKYLGLL